MLPIMKEYIGKKLTKQQREGLYEAFYSRYTGVGESFPHMGYWKKWVDENTILEEPDEKLKEDELKMAILERNCLVYSDVIQNMDNKLNTIKNIVEDDIYTNKQKVLMIKAMFDYIEEVD